MKRIFFALVLAVFFTLSLVALAPAATYYWDTDGATAGFGSASGTWAAPTPGTTVGWSQSSTGATLTDANVTTTLTDPLNFGSATHGLGTGSITVSGTQNAASLTFGSASGAGVTTLSGGTINLAATSSITVNNTADTISSVISGAGTGLTKAGTGTLTLSSANTYTGSTTIAAGTVQVNNASALGSAASAVTVNTAATGTSNTGLLVGSGLTLSRPITITNNGTGVSTIGANGNTGATIFSGTITLDRDATISGQNTSTTTANHDGTGAQTRIDSSIVGTGNLTITGGNLVQFRNGGPKTYSGQTLVTDNTTLSLWNSAGTPLNSTINIDAGSTVVGEGITSTLGGLAGGGVLTSNSAWGASNLSVGNNNASTTFSGTINNSGGATINLTKIGTGTLTLSGVNSYTGTTAIGASGGTLQIGGAGQLGSGSYAGAIAIGSSGTFQYSSSAAQTLSGAITGAGALIKDTSSSVLTLDNANGYTGGTTVSRGTLQGNNNNSFGNSAGTITLGDGNTGANNIALGTTAAGTSNTISNPITVSSSGSGTVTIFGTSDATHADVFSNTITLNRATTFSELGGTSARTSITGKVTGNVGTLTIGAGRVTLDNTTNDFVGNITINSGAVLQINSGGGVIPDASNVQVNGELHNGAGTNETIAGLTGTGIVRAAQPGGFNFTVGSGNATSTFDGTFITGASGGKLIKTGTGTLTLTNTGSTFNQVTDINDGTLELGNGTVNGIAGSVGININSVTSVLKFNNGLAQTFGQAITGTGSLTKSGPGTLTLSVANSYSGATTIAAGTIQVNNASALGSAASAVTVNTAATGTSNTGLLVGSNLTLSRPITITNNGTGVSTIGANGNTGATIFSGTITLDRDATISGQNTSTTTANHDGTGAQTRIDSSIVGTGNLTITGGNLVQFRNGGPKTYSGQTLITGNTTLSLWNSAGTPLNSTINIDAGSTVVGEGITSTLGGLAGGGVLTSNGAWGASNLSVGNNNASTTFSGTINNSGGATVNLTKIGTGTLTFSGTNNSTGTTLVAGGVLSVADVGALGQGTGANWFAVQTGGTLQYTGTGAQTSTNRDIYWNSGAATIEIASATGNLTFNSSGGTRNQALTKSGAGTLTLAASAAGAADVTGTINISAGTMAFNATGANGATWSGAINGSGSILKTGSGAGALTLSTANGYSGGTTISQGALTLTNATAAGSNTITLNDANTGANNTTLNFNLGSGNLANAITVANLGSGTVTLNQGVAFSTLSGLITLNRATTITGGGADRVGISGKITGIVGTLTVTGAPRVTFDQTAGNASDFIGNVLISAGTMQMNSIYGVPSTADVTVNGGAVFRLVSGAGSTVSINGLNGAGNVNGDTGGGNYLKTLSVGNNGGGGSHSGVISNGSGSDTLALVKNGIGTQTLSGANTYTGTTAVSQGTLTLLDNAINTSTTGATTISSGATLELSTNGGTYSSPRLTSSKMSGTGTLNVTGGGNVGLSSTATDFAGQVNVSGTSMLMSWSVLANLTANVDVAAGSRFSVANTVVQMGGLSGGGDVFQGWDGTTQTLTVGAANQAGSFSGVIHGNGSSATQGNLERGILGLTKIGAGTQTLSGANTYIGATTVNGGTLKAGVASVANVSGAFGNNSAVTLANTAGVTLDITGFNTQIGSLTGGGAAGGNVTLGAATLTIGGNNTSPAAFAGVISGVGGSLIKIGTGALTLSGANSYSGGTTVNAGYISITNAAALGSGPLTINTANNYVVYADGLPTGTQTLANDIVLPSDASLAYHVIDHRGGAGNVLKLTGTISGGSANTVLYLNTADTADGSGIVEFDGNNTFVTKSTLDSNGTTGGGIVVNRGAIQVNSANALGAATNSVFMDSYAPNTIIFGGSFNYTHPTQAAFAALTLNTGANNVTASGVLSSVGAVGITKTGTGTLTLTAPNTYTGSTLVTAGSLKITTGGSIAIGAASDVTIAGATTPTFAIEGGSASGRYLVVGNATPGNFSMTSGAGNFTALYLGGPTGGGGGSAADANYTQSGGTMSIAGPIGISYQGEDSVMSVTGGSLTATGVIFFSGANSGTAQLNISGTGLVSADKLELGFSGSFGNLGTVNLNAGGTLKVNQIEFQKGAYNVNFNGGTLMAGDSALANFFAHNAGTTANVLAGGAIVDTNGQAITVTQALVNGGGNGGLSKISSGTLTLAGANANTYTGLTTLSAGVLELNKTAGVNAIAGDGNTGTYDVQIAGGTLLHSADEQIANNALINMTSGAWNLNGRTETIHAFTNSGGTFTTGVGGDLIGLGNTITWAGGSNTINADGTTTDSHYVITGGTNTVQGAAGLPVGVAGGQLIVAAPGGVGLVFGGTASPTLTVNSDATSAGGIVLNNNVTVDGTLTSGTAQILNGGSATNPGYVNLNAATRTFDINNGSDNVDMLISARIQNGALNKNGAGTLRLTGDNTYTGSTTVNAGTLELAAPGNLQNGSINVNAGGTFRQTGGTNNVTGASGSLNLAAGSSYQLQGGTLDFGDYAAGGTAWNPADTSTITMATGSQFSFTGGDLRDVSTITVTDGSAFTQSGGNFYVGQHDAGVAAETTIDGGFALLGGVLRLDIFGKDLTPEQCCDNVPSNNDQLTVTGEALLDSTISLNFAGSYEPEFGDAFTLICADNITLDDGFAIDGGFYRVVPTGLGPGLPQFALQAIVPEPASVAVWTLVGLAGAAGAFRLRGRVTFQGQPLGRGEVRYLPVDGQGRVARGKIDASSNFKLTTLTAGDGALPGEYRVVVIVLPEAEKDATAEQDKKGKGAPQANVQAPPIPARYYAPETSGLADTVNGSHSGYKEFDLVP